MEITEFIGKAISYYREQKGWSTVQLAEKSGLSQGSISLYENGKRNPSDAAIERICAALEISIKVLQERAEDIYRHSRTNEKSEPYRLRDPEYTRMRKLDRIFHMNDFVYEMSPDIYIGVNARIYDLISQEELFRGPRRDYSFGKKDNTILAHLIEKVFYKFIEENKDEIAYRIHEELRNLDMTAYELLENFRKRY